MTKRTQTAAALLAVAIIAAACDRTETLTRSVTTSSPAGSSTVPSSAAAKQRDNALVRVLHVVPSNTFDLFAGDLLLFEGLGFKTVTPYRAVDGKRYAFALRSTGMTQATVLSSNTENLTDGDFYTAIAMPGDGDGPLLRVVNDHLDSPSAGKARLRIVHAGSGTGQIDVRASGSSSALFDDVDYRTVSDYKDVAPMNGQLEVVGGAAAIDAHLEAGRFYTLVIVASAGAPTKVEAFLIEDALSP